MSEKPNDGILELIRKILSRTEANGCTQAEAEAAFAMASRKLAEHNLTMEDVVAPQGGEESFIEEALHETGRWSLEDNLCYGILKEFYFVEGFFNRPNGRKVFMIFGKPDNVATARFIWSALHASFDRCWTMYRFLNKRPANEKRLFVAGMAKGFIERMREEREAQIIERDLVQGQRYGTALALTSIAKKTELAYRKSPPRPQGEQTLDGRARAAIGPHSTPGTRPVGLSTSTGPSVPAAEGHWADDDEEASFRAGQHPDDAS